MRAGELCMRTLGALPLQAPASCPQSSQIDAMGAAVVALTPCAARPARGRAAARPAPAVLPTSSSVRLEVHICRIKGADYWRRLPPPPPAAACRCPVSTFSANTSSSPQACLRRPRSRRLTPLAAAAQDGWQQPPQQPAGPQRPGGAVGRFLAAFNSSPRSLEGMLACLAPDVAYHNLALAPEPFRGQQASEWAGRSGGGRAADRGMCTLSRQAHALAACAQ